MRTKFSISEEVFTTEGSLEENYSYYEKYYKEYGWILDRKEQSVYKIHDYDFNLSEGERVCIDGCLRIVSWKCVDIDDMITEYELKEE